MHTTRLAICWMIARTGDAVGWALSAVGWWVSSLVVGLIALRSGIARLNVAIGRRFNLLSLAIMPPDTRAAVWSGLPERARRTILGEGDPD